MIHGEAENAVDDDSDDEEDAFYGEFTGQLNDDVPGGGISPLGRKFALGAWAMGLVVSARIPVSSSGAASSSAPSKVPLLTTQNRASTPMSAAGGGGSLLGREVPAD